MASAKLYNRNGEMVLELKGNEAQIQRTFDNLKVVASANRIEWVERDGPIYRSSTNGLMLISDMQPSHAANAAFNIFADRIAPNIRLNARRFGHGVERLGYLVYGQIGVDPDLPLYDETYRELCKRAFESEL